MDKRCNRNTEQQRRHDIGELLGETLRERKPVRNDNGRVSKLTLVQDSKVVYNYDRGEDVEPQTSEAEKALAILLKEYN